VEGSREGATAIRKHTTRPRRDEERGDRWSDLIHVSEAEFERLGFDYAYRFRGYRYGFSRKEIDGALSAGPIGLVVVRDGETIGRVKRDLAGARSISVLVRASEASRRARLSSLPEPAAPDPDPDRYDEVLVNEGSAQEFHDAIDAMIGRFASARLRGRTTA
jgi:hypothetical protein